MMIMMMIMMMMIMIAVKMMKMKMMITVTMVAALPRRNFTDTTTTPRLGSSLTLPCLSRGQSCVVRPHQRQRNAIRRKALRLDNTKGD